MMHPTESCENPTLYHTSAICSFKLLPASIPVSVRGISGDHHTPPQVADYAHRQPRICPHLHGEGARVRECIPYVVTHCDAGRRIQCSELVTAGSTWRLPVLEVSGSHPSKNLTSKRAKLHLGGLP